MCKNKNTPQIVDWNQQEPNNLESKMKLKAVFAISFYFY